MEINQSSLLAAFTGFQMAFQNGFDLAPSHYDKVATLTTSTTKQEMYPWMGRTTWFREWFGDRTLQSLEAHQYTLVNRDFENTVVISRNDFMDDTYGLYTPVFTQLGMDAREHPDALVFALMASGTTNLCYDGQPFFNANHPTEVNEGAGLTYQSNINSSGSSPWWYLLDTRRALKPLIFQKRLDYRFISMMGDTDELVFNRKEFRYGVDARVNAGYGFWQYAYASNQPLNATNYALARAAMRNITADNGKPLNIMPNTLVCGPSNEAAALLLFNTAFAPSTAGTATQSNIWQGFGEVIVTPWVGA